jgi:kynurenine formamidase
VNELPGFDDLPRSEAGAPYAWHFFGDGDNVGMFNLQTPKTVLNAIDLVRKGSVFSLNAPVDLFTPSLSHLRSPVRRKILGLSAPGIAICDDVLDNFFPQASSQWDALGHVSTTSKEFYNGASEDEVRSGERNGIEHWARRGIAGRGIVLDLEAVHPDYDRSTDYAFTVEDLERARVAADLEYKPGDVIILNTGFAKWYSELGEFEKMRLTQNVTTPGLEHSEDICRYLWNAHPAAVVCDTYAVEVFPPQLGPDAGPYGFIHQILIAGLGIAFGELWWLADLVDDCRTDHVFECLLVSAPMNVPGGIGSTANALALK